MIKIILMLSLVASLNAYGQNINNNKNTMTSIDSNVSLFISNYENCSMNIQSAGVATIPKASLDKGELHIEYAYQSESENRKGKMTLQDKGNNRFEGNWKTNADNGNSYQGTLFFEFDETGNAKGYYKFGGGDFEISIQKTRNDMIEINDL